MNMCVRELLYFVLWTGAAENIIFSERRVGDICTYIHVCSFDIFPARGSVECAVKAIHADTELLLYEATHRKCSVCHPTQPDVNQVAKGKRFYIAGKCPLRELPYIFPIIFTASSDIPNISYIVYMAPF